MHITTCNSKKKKKKKKEEKWKKLIVLAVINYLDGMEGAVVDNLRRTGDFSILTPLLVVG